ncbi:MAG TPA: hypothetical protein PLO61_09135 [Fimbriimonadaceae bacterium]|nr:hypothetical protein [Fimbriimonadaceae bacterium]HRJ33824.1 hypothetical protein [Fimbriimonadaceae bacterium]
MYLCLRLDLDYVPWDTPDAQDYGHGEPAMVLRLLELARQTGYKYHFFASNRVLRAFRSAAETILNEGHHLDWYCKHPEAFDVRYHEAQSLFAQMGSPATGLAVRSIWPEPELHRRIPEELTFLSAAPGPCPASLKLYPVETRADRESLRSGVSLRNWAEQVRTHIRQCATLNQPVTVVFRPQVLAKHDPRGQLVREIAELGKLSGLKNRTLREVHESQAGVI